MNFRKICFVFSFCSAVITTASAQENVVPLRYQLTSQHKPVLLKSTAQSLPFFEDFLARSRYPDATRWVQNRQVYISNDMAVNPISQGAAVMDALGANGRPYDTVDAFSVRYADSLTSVPFNLAGYGTNDGVVLRFFYQPQGNGFSPEPSDSLMLYYRSRNGQWHKQWSRPGTTAQNFQQAVLPVADTSFLYNGFQFRFVNKASVNLNDDVWLLDFIRLESGTNAGDTVLNDVSVARAPANLLRDYTAMPYRHFTANAAAERVVNLGFDIRNARASASTVAVGYSATDVRNGAVIGSGSSTVTIAAGAVQPVALPAYTALPAAAPYEKVIFRHRLYGIPSAAQFSTANDTLVKDQVFDNYFAYDDGTAEKAYYLNLLPSLPGKLAIEFHANVPDTLRGADILFGQQVPTSAGKYFSIQVYRKIAGINNAPADELLYSQDYYQPRFTDTVNGFYTYTFDQAVALPAGTFYLGLMQPALSGSDSLYYALDANRAAGNHLYYNVDGTWRGSTLSGALMARPLVGAPVARMAVNLPEMQAANWKIYPNPAAGALHLQGVPLGSLVRVVNVYGSTLFEARYEGAPLMPAGLAAGSYWVQWKAVAGQWSSPEKWILLLAL